MHQTMIGLMAKMMPFMMPLIYAGGVILVAGVLALLAKVAAGKGDGLARFLGWLLVVLGIFFLASQAMGMLLGAAPSINLANSAAGKFDLKPFWQVGLAMVVPGIVIVVLSGMTRGDT